jgi:D-alanyl-D-alanine endopeptidase (penicillin-binding protein 7)
MKTGIAPGPGSDVGAATGAAIGSGMGSGIGPGTRPGAVQESLHPFAQDGAGSVGEAIGLHRVADPLALRSAVALVVDAGNGEILYEKNANAVLPIASITKVMMSMVVLDARQPLGEKITIDETDRDTERSSSSKLPMGSTLTRAELLQLALMSSENRAASALARSYPGGLSAFVSAATRKAAAIGMRDSVFMDGTGLSSSNVSTARDLAVMVEHASRYPLISEYSTASELRVRTPHGSRIFRTTNRMVGGSDWDLSLQKTGYISESGNCLVMRGSVDGRRVILVLLDSFGRYSRLGDAQRIRRWLEG